MQAPPSGKTERTPVGCLHKCHSDSLITSFLTVRLPRTFHMNRPNGLLAHDTGFGGVEKKRKKSKLNPCVLTSSPSCVHWSQCSVWPVACSMAVERIYMTIFALRIYWALYDLDTSSVRSADRLDHFSATDSRLSAGKSSWDYDFSNEKTEQWSLNKLENNHPFFIPTYSCVSLHSPIGCQSLRSCFSVRK